MLKYEIEKNINYKKRLRKHKSIELPCDLGHMTEISSLKAS